MSNSTLYPGRNSLIHKLRDFFCIETSIDKNPYTEIMGWSTAPSHDYGLIIKAFNHFRANGTFESLDYFDIKLFQANLFEFENELKDVSINARPTAAKDFFNELKDVWVPMVVNLPDVTADFGGMDELKLPEFRIDRVEEDLPPGERYVNSFESYFTGYYNPFITPGKRWVDKTIPIPPETPEQIAGYFKLYNELINELRNQFLTIANKYISLWEEGKEEKQPKASLVNKNNPIAFHSLFSSKEVSELSIQILKDVIPPVINSKGYYILGKRQKGSITAWVAALKQKGIIHNITDNNLAVIINKRIKGLDIDERTLRNIGTTAYIKYFTQILARIS